MAGYSGCSNKCKPTMGDYLGNVDPTIAGTSKLVQGEVQKDSKKMVDMKVKENAEDSEDSEGTEDAEETEDAVETEDAELSDLISEAQLRVNVALFLQTSQSYQVLNRDLNDWEQGQMKCDMEIGRVPERKGEDLVRIVVEIGDLLGVHVLKRHVEFAVRFGLRWPIEGQETTHARRIVVRLSSRSLRDALLGAAFTRHNLFSNDLGLFGPPQRIYFIERLTPINCRLYRMARAQCRNKGWQYLWIKHGRIYVRKDIYSKIYRIRNEDNVNRAFDLQ